MNDNLVESILIVDRSGSMSSIREQTINGINEFIESQRNLDVDCHITLIQFDDQYEVVIDKQNAKDISPITEDDFVPRGMTALNDAIGNTLMNVGNRLAQTTEEERPSKVVVAIVTDGQENASREFKPEVIKEMITEQEKTYNWTFLYIAANQDAVKEAHLRGISSHNTLSFASTGVQGTQGSQGAFRAMNNYVSAVYKNAPAAFTDEDRNAAMGNSAL